MAAARFLSGLPRLSWQEVSGDECMICLQPYEAAADVVRLPCNHVMDLSCLSTWLLEDNGKVNNSCPYCRRAFFDLPVPPEQLEAAARRRRPRLGDGRFQGMEFLDTLEGRIDEIRTQTAEYTVRARELTAATRVLSEEEELLAGHPTTRREYTRDGAPPTDAGNENAGGLAEARRRFEMNMALQRQREATTHFDRQIQESHVRTGSLAVLPPPQPGRSNDDADILRRLPPPPGLTNPHPSLMSPYGGYPQSGPHAIWPAQLPPSVPQGGYLPRAPQGESGSMMRDQATEADIPFTTASENIPSRPPQAPFHHDNPLNRAYLGYPPHHQPFSQTRETSRSSQFDGNGPHYPAYRAPPMLSNPFTSNMATTANPLRPPSPRPMPRRPMSGLATVSVRTVSPTDIGPSATPQNTPASGSRAGSGRRET